jgi:hypothetical protein
MGNAAAEEQKRNAISIFTGKSTAVIEYQAE